MLAHLLTNPKHLRAFLDAIDHPIVLLSKDYCTVEMNCTAKKVLQCNTETEHAKTFVEFCAKQGYSLKAWLESTEQHPIAHEETYLVDNQSYSILWRIIPFAAIADNVEGCILFGCDITPEKYITNKLRKTEFFYDNILAKLPTNVYWKDVNSVYLGCNDRLAKLMGLPSRDAIVGMTDFDFDWGAEAAKSFVEFDKQVMRTDHALTTEDVFKDAKGQYVTVLTNKTPLKNEQGEAVGVLAISVDITDKKQAELELIKAKNEAEAANQAKSVFLANISHDIRTPLVGMLGLTESLKQNSENEKNKEDAQLLIGVTQEILHLLNEVIETVRLNNNQSIRENKVFSIKTIVIRTVTLIAAAAKNKKIDLRYTIDENVPPYLIGNVTYLNRSLLNLLSNAVKFTQKGHISLSIGVTKTIENEVFLECSIEDTGIGISPDQFEKIFENFHRLNPSYEGIYKGNGMGLYIVKKYVEAMNGVIHVKSELGSGSAFIMTIPFKISLLPPLEEKQILPEEQPVSVHDEKKFVKKTTLENFSVKDPLATILVVEDDALAARSVRHILQQADCASDHAMTGEEALEKMKNNHYDLVLMDIGLPDFDGCEVTRRIRQHISAEQLPIVALTGHMLPERKKECVEAGMQDMFIKPMNNQILQNLLGTHVFPADGILEEERKAITASINTKISLDELKTIDLEEGVRLLGGSLKSAKEMIGFLLQSLSDDIQAIQENYASQNMEMLYRTIHKFYGGLCYCGVPRLRAITYRLKCSLAAKELTDLDQQIQMLLAEATHVCTEGKKYS